MTHDWYLTWQVDLLLIGEEGKSYYVLIKEFNTFKYDIHYIVVENFSIIEIVKSHFNNCFKINDEKMIKMPEKGEYVRFKNYERIINSLFMIYADFESIFVPEDNWKQNPDECYRSKHQKHVVCSHGYEVMCVDDKFSKSYLGDNR